MKIPYQLGDVIEQKYRVIQVLEQDRTQTTYEVEAISDCGCEASPKDSASQRHRHKAVAIVPFWQKILLILETSPNYSHPVEGKNKSRRLIIKLSSNNYKKIWQLLFLIFPSLIISYYIWGLVNNISFVSLFTTNFIALILLATILITFIIVITGRENYLEIDDHNFLIQWKYWRFKYQITGKTKDITDLELRYQTSEQSDRGLITNAYCCVIWEGVKQYKFGAWLKEQEQEWLLGEISRFIMEKD